jgi:transposase
VNTISDQQGSSSRRRRLHSDEFKADAVASCMQPGMSMAAVAIAHGVNANLLRRWVRQAELRPPGTALDKRKRAANTR